MSVVGVVENVKYTGVASPNESVIYRPLVTAPDLTALAASAVCLFAVALVATLIPAARAARVDPAIALRSE
jgi:ABC-type lipoprotein release transport system permease subunit